MIKEKEKDYFIRIVINYKKLRQDKKDKVYMGTHILIAQEFIRLKEI